MKQFMVIVLLIIASVTLFCEEILLTGSGTVGDPYIIESFDNLKYLSSEIKTLKTKYFIQTENIVCPAEDNFIPIGTSLSYPFKGNYDGCNHTISKLTINRDLDYVGLFGRTEGATIRNLKLLEVKITGYRFTGAITGYSESTKIINCSSNGYIEDANSTSSWIGGISGALITDSHIKYCSSATILNGVQNIGGITGVLGLNSSLKNSYFTGEIHNGSPVGGLVGFTNLISPVISNCYSKCTIEPEIGVRRGMLVGWNKTTHIDSCAYLYSENIEYIGENLNITINAEINKIIALPEEHFSEVTNFTGIGWDFETIWHLGTDDSFPTLFWQQDQPLALIEITDEAITNYPAPSASAELEFSEPPVGSNFLITLHPADNIQIPNLDNSQRILGSNYWSIKTNNADNLEYTLKLSLKDNHASVTQDIVNVLKRDDSSSEWVDITELGGQFTLQDNIITITGLTSFSDFVPVIDYSTLPVELSSFTAIASDNYQVQLNWTVESESNLLGYYILKNETNNLDSATIIPALIEAENSVHTHHYGFHDYPDTNALMLYYWLKSVDLSNEIVFYGPVSVSLKNNENSTPAINLGNQLYANYPNPFNPETAISFNLAEATVISLNIYNAKGQLVNTLLRNKKMNKGHHSFVWNGRDNRHLPVASGLYLYKLESKNFSEMGRMTLLK